MMRSKMMDSTFNFIWRYGVAHLIYPHCASLIRISHLICNDQLTLNIQFDNQITHWFDFTLSLCYFALEIRTFVFASSKNICVTCFLFIVFFLNFFSFLNRIRVIIHLILYVYLYLCNCKLVHVLGARAHTHIIPYLALIFLDNRTKCNGICTANEHAHTHEQTLSI